ncbi:Hypothetical protein CINCED_3A023573 [Cinara cedri]|uniref:Uncharacterized protein n=1 Tax=Cinara cedri TaxID=506608 RepID=A0A5E4NJH1_9HEMI|nr:Hypothetical protein CINCED_3A023573 [Cinara cedri]
MIEKRSRPHNNNNSSTSKKKVKGYRTAGSVSRGKPDKTNGHQTRSVTRGLDGMVDLRRRNRSRPRRSRRKSSRRRRSLSRRSRLRSSSQSTRNYEDNGNDCTENTSAETGEAVAHRMRRQRRSRRVTNDIENNSTDHRSSSSSSSNPLPANEEIFIYFFYSNLISKRENTWDEVL